MVAGSPVADRTYIVPQRFGTRTMLVAMGAFGALLAVGESADVSLTATIYYAVFLGCVCLAQMIFHRAPRASAPQWQVTPR